MFGQLLKNALAHTSGGRLEDWRTPKNSSQPSRLETDG